MVFFRIPPPPSDQEDTDVSKIERAIKNANDGTKSGVTTFVADSSSKTNQILMNTVKIRCGTDMCLSKDIDLKDFRCEDVDSAVCGVHEKQCKNFEGRRCSDQCTYDETQEVSTTCGTNTSPNDCRDHHPSCRWYNGKCNAAAVKTTEDACKTKSHCTWAQVTKRGRRENRCITDFRKTATRGCFAKCQNPKGSEQYDCIEFLKKGFNNTCPESFDNLDVNDSRQIDLCKKWAMDTLVPEDKLKEMAENFDCDDDDCKNNVAPALTDADAEIFCRTKTCVKDEGYDSVVHPIFSNEGEVLGCPEINGKQYWPFPYRPDGYKFDQTICDQVCDNSDSAETCDEEKGCKWDDVTNKCTPDLIFSGKLIIAGKGDKGMCNVVNVDMQNHAEQANETVSNTLNAVDLRVIRNAMTDVARNVAQSGFDWDAKQDIQNLSKNVVHAAQEIRTRASQDCGGSQNLQNSFTKKCMNMAKNGRAMPCTMGDVDQTNVATAVTECLQNVFVQTDVLKQTVQHVKQKSDPTNLSNTFVPDLYDRPIVKKFVDLKDVTPYTWARITNTTLILYIATIIAVGVIVIWFSEQPVAKKTTVMLGSGSILVALVFLLIGAVCGGAEDAVKNKKESAESKVSFDGFMGLARVPEEGQYKQRYGTINEVAETCRRDKDCKAWVFENDEIENNFCSDVLCNVSECLNEGKCEGCCPTYCTTMFTDGDIVPEENNDCKGNSFNDCKKPCMWGGTLEDGACEYSPNAWGTATRAKKPDRVWCMSCREQKGMGYMYTDLNRTDSQYFDEEEKPITKPLTASELACFSRVPKTMGIKYIKQDPFKEDAIKIFRIGMLGLGVGIVCLLISLVFKDAVSKSKVTPTPAAAPAAVPAAVI